MRDPDCPPDTMFVMAPEWLLVSTPPTRWRRIRWRLRHPFTRYPDPLDTLWTVAHEHEATIAAVSGISDVQRGSSPTARFTETP